MKNLNKNICITIVWFLLYSTTLFAQTFEIRCVSKGAGAIGVEVRETSGSNTPSTSDYVTDIVFGLVWDTSYKVDLGATITTSFYITKAGTRTVKGTKHFQAFYANNTPYNFPTNWGQNSWVEIASLTNNLGGTGTGTFEIAQMGFHATTDPNFGLNLDDFTPTINGSASSVPLPINLLTFDAELMGDAALVTWSTASESNSSHFVVERSTDGVKFTPVGEVNAAGFSSTIQQYSLIDPLDNVNKAFVFYRLKSVDWDETYALSSIIRLDLSISLNNMLIYPCPFKDLVYIDFSNSENEEMVDIEVFDALGTTVHSQLNASLEEDLLSINLVHLSAGMYHLVITQNGIKQSVKLLK